MMRAMVLRGPGTALVEEERETPVPGPGRVLVAVEACGVCRTDLHVVDGELPEPVAQLGEHAQGRGRELGPETAPSGRLMG